MPVAAAVGTDHSNCVRARLAKPAWQGMLWHHCFLLRICGCSNFLLISYHHRGAPTDLPARPILHRPGRRGGHGTTQCRAQRIGGREAASAWDACPTVHVPIQSDVATASPGS